MCFDPMRVVTLGRGFLLVCLFLVVSLSNADEQRYEVVGVGECGDCKENNFKTSEAFSGLHVTIDCKFENGEIKRIGDGELDEGGKFKISLPQDMIRDGKSLKEECYAQLYSGAIPCPAHNGLEATKIVFKSQTDGRYTFSPTKTLKFSSALCNSKFLWPYFKYPPMPKSHSWKKSWPKIAFPPLKKWPLPPLIPVYNPPPVKPLPPPTPVYKPKPPTVKPLPPPTPIYKPKPPVYKPKPPVYEPPKKPLPPPTPIYKPTPKPPVYKPKPPVYEPPKKPLPPPTPIYKPTPKPPVYKPKPPVYQPPKKPLPPPTPVYKPKPPVETKPLPPPFPLYPIPPFFKKPCPPFSKIPPKYFKHPKFGYFPPLPPFFPHP